MVVIQVLKSYKKAKCFSEKTILKIRYQRLVIVNRRTFQNLTSCKNFNSKSKFLETICFKIFFIDKVLCKVWLSRKSLMQNHVSQNSTRIEVSVAFAESIESKRDFFKVILSRIRFFGKEFQLKVQVFQRKFIRLCFSKSKNE